MEFPHYVVDLMNNITKIKISFSAAAGLKFSKLI